MSGATSCRCCPDVYNLYRLSGDLDPRQLATRGLLPHCSAEPVWLSERLVFLGSIARRDKAAPSLLGYILRGGRVEKDAYQRRLGAGL